MSNVCQHLESAEPTLIAGQWLSPILCDSCLFESERSRAIAEGWKEYRRSGLKEELSIESLDELDGIETTPGFYLSDSLRKLSLIALHLASRTKHLETHDQPTGTYIHRAKRRVAAETWAYRPAVNLIAPLRLKVLEESAEIHGLEQERGAWSEASFPGCLILLGFGQTRISPQRASQTGGAIRRYAAGLLERCRSGRWTMAVHPGVLPEWLPSELKPLLLDAP